MKVYAVTITEGSETSFWTTLEAAKAEVTTTYEWMSIEFGDEEPTEGENTTITAYDTQNGEKSRGWDVDPVATIEIGELRTA